MYKYRRFDNDKWFQFGRNQGMGYANEPKLIAPEISLGGNYTIDSDGRYYSTTKVYGYVKKKNIPISYPFLLGILNSAVFWFFIQNTGYVLRGGYYTFKTNYVAPFPFPDFESLPMDLVSRIEALVEEMLKDKRTDTETARIQSKIDELVCILYNIDINALNSASTR